MAKAKKESLVKKGDDCELVDEDHIVCKTADGGLKECDIKNNTCKKISAD